MLEGSALVRPESENKKSEPDLLKLHQVFLNIKAQ